jgi:hypothetical protein
MAKLNNYRIGKWGVLVWLTGHAAAFTVLAPMKLWLSIPLCLILLAYIIWNMGIFKKAIPPEDAGIPLEISSDLQPAGAAEIAEIAEIPEEIQVDKQSEQ